MVNFLTIYGCLSSVYYNNSPFNTHHTVEDNTGMYRLNSNNFPTFCWCKLLLYLTLDNLCSKEMTWQDKITKYAGDKFLGNLVISDETGHTLIVSVTTPLIFWSFVIFISPCLLPACHGYQGEEGGPRKKKQSSPFIEFLYVTWDTF